MDDELDYGEVMSSYAEKAEEQAILSEDPKDAWLRIDPGQIWWPNPLYCGPDVPHPESRSVIIGSRAAETKMFGGPIGF